VENIEIENDGRIEIGCFFYQGALRWIGEGNLGLVYFSKIMI